MQYCLWSNFTEINNTFNIYIYVLIVYIFKDLTLTITSEKSEADIELEEDHSEISSINVQSFVDEQVTIAYCLYTLLILKLVIKKRKQVKNKLHMEFC